MNRAHETKIDDEIRIPSVTLYDIDFAILKHLKNLSLTIEQNGKTIEVPIMMAGGDKWAQFQKNGYLRDDSNNTIVPIILLKRNDISESQLLSKLHIPREVLGPNRLKYTAVKQTNNRNDWKRDNNKKSETFYVTAIPDYVEVSYDIYIWTYLTSQMNKIVEQIYTQQKLQWGEAFKFITMIEGVNFDSMHDVGTDNLIRSTISIRVNGYLMPEYIAKESTARKVYGIKRMQVITEIH